MYVPIYLYIMFSYILNIYVIYYSLYKGANNEAHFIFNAKVFSFLLEIVI